MFDQEDNNLPEEICVCSAIQVELGGAVMTVVGRLCPGTGSGQ